MMQGWANHSIRDGRRETDESDGMEGMPFLLWIQWIHKQARLHAALATYTPRRDHV